MIVEQLVLPSYAVTELPERIANRVVVTDGGCWQWTGCTREGYGKIHVGDKNWRVHRLAYISLVGPIPNGLVLDHLCRNRACCNPDHLEPVTNAENLRRGAVNTGPAHAYWSARTHCPRGHEYDQVNTGRSTRGSRICRACARDKMRARRAFPARRTRGAA